MKARGSLGILLLLLSSFAIGQDHGGLRKRLTNQDVIGMVQTGLSEDVITAKIRAANATDPGTLDFEMGGGKAGVKSDKEIPFQAEHLGIRTYKITLDHDLKPGEYAFFMATGQQVGETQGRGTGGAATGRIYDFRIPE